MILTLFARVEGKYGSIDGYLDTIGLDADARAAIAAALLTDAAA